MTKHRIHKKIIADLLAAAVVLGIQPFSVLAAPALPEMIAEEETPDIIMTSVSSNTSDMPAASISSNTMDNTEASAITTRPAAVRARTANVPEGGGTEGKDLEEADFGDSKFHTVTGLNPEGAVVNLFDYWQFEGDPQKEYAFDDSVDGLGISLEHLLRFSQNGIAIKDNDDQEQTVLVPGQWNRWTGSAAPHQNIVNRQLGSDGFPKLSLSEEMVSKAVKKGEEEGDYTGRYGIKREYNSSEKRNESLAYLFSTAKEDESAFKKSYEDVEGLFRINDKGNYYYDSKENFAWLDENGGKPRFVLYDSPGVGKDPYDSGSLITPGNYGQFFPLNKAADVFDKVYDVTDDAGHPFHLSYEGNGKIDTDNFLSCTDEGLNHYLGMTLEVPFLQPEKGELPDGTDMSFTFSGDDDVWIFIDDVLVADIGGIHDACGVTINFADGRITFFDPSDGKELTAYKTTLFGAFQSVRKNNVGFTGNTFADHTVHNLKMFYLERGHVASNLRLEFNLQPPRYHQLKKIGQDGETLADTEFSLYPAIKCGQKEEGSVECNELKSGGGSNATPPETYYVKIDDSEKPLLTFRTDENGIADFIDQQEELGYNFNDSDSNYYILRETKPPGGYRPLPIDIVLIYDRDTTMLSVANRWQTGAYASFTAYVNEPLDSDMTYGKYENDDDFIKESNDRIRKASFEKGLVLGVPLIKSQDGEWLPLYGNNMTGFQTVEIPKVKTQETISKALLETALRQCVYEDDWYLSWNEETKSLEGELSDLPGRADRYLTVNKNGDMQMLYIILEPDVFDSIIPDTGSGAEGRYAALKDYVIKQGISKAVERIYGQPDGNAAFEKKNVNLMVTDQFVQLFRSLIYVPNERRELRVKKVDENGNPLNGAKFSIFKSREDALSKHGAIVTGETADVRDKNRMEKGLLIFKSGAEGNGYANMPWETDPVQTTYYLREISAPGGYKTNETIIPVVLGAYSVYADAGTPDDGVSVEAGVGQLYQTMTKYAADGVVDITLRDITVSAQTQASEGFQPDGWETGAGDTKNLHYNLQHENDTWLPMDYGLHQVEHKENPEATPFFKAETGYLRTGIVQNTAALEKSDYEEATFGSDQNRWENLNGIELTGLFSLLNVVVVEDKKGENPPENPPNNPPNNPPDNPTKPGDAPDDDPGGGSSDSPFSSLISRFKTIVGKDAPADAEQASAQEPGRLGTPQTGDSSMVWWWAVLAIISLLGICTTAYNLFLKKQAQKKTASGRKKKKAKKRK